jgi:chromosome segregation ATPase
MDQELKDYLDRQADHLEREFAEAREFRKETSRRFEEVDRQFAELRDEVHQARILVEKLDDKIDLVAEGVQSNTEVMHRLVDEKGRELREHKVVMESAHRHLEQRVSRHDTEIAALGSRVRQLET